MTRRFLPDVDVPEPKPPSRIMRAIRMTLLAVLLGALMYCYAYLDMTGPATYGWSLFVGIPLVSGLASGLSWRVLGNNLWYLAVFFAYAALGVAALLLIVTGIEGLVCVAMATPLALLVGGVGFGIGAFLQWLVFGGPIGGAKVLVVLLSVPLMMSVERAADRTPPVYRATTTIDIDAPPEVVWKYVVDFPPLPDPTEAMFRWGIAYPMHATIDGAGVGAERRCVFNTGDFVEPVTTWDPPRLLAFDVTENPHPMVEWNPMGPVHPPHLEGFLEAQRGEFRLEPLPGGGTRIHGTTWYRHGLWPASYWRLWSDEIIHQVHGRVLRHIKGLAEMQN